MDLVPEDQRKMVWTESRDTHYVIRTTCGSFPYFILSVFQIFDQREAELMKRSLPLECTCFKTSIWDETLYKVGEGLEIAGV